MVTEELLSTEVKEKAKELGQKYFPDSENIWARSNIEAERVELACLEMAEWVLKDAIECTVHEDAGGYPYIPNIELYDYEKDRPTAKKGDKIKILIIKDYDNG